MSGATGFCLFDRALMRRHWERAASSFPKHNALFEDTAMQVQDRLEDVKQSFTTALDLSPFPFLARRKENTFSVLTPSPFPDEETLPYPQESFDLIVSNMGLHWVNDLPEALRRCYKALKPQGLFLAAFIGGQSLRELRACLWDAELEMTGGVSPRVSPMVDLRTAGNLLRRAGFHLPVADIETVTLLYKDMSDLLKELRGTGQTNAHVERLRRPTRRSVFQKAERLYQDRFGREDGMLPATFDIMHLHGWKKI